QCQVLEQTKQVNSSMCRPHDLPYSFLKTINGKYKLPPCVNHFPPEREPATPDPAVCLLSKMISVTSHLCTFVSLHKVWL
uniref:Uncharacterized protein n=1 Tax=Cairina moschata TaxID=8855 RepID=A0A8C3B6B4_CAIMO